MQQKAAKSAKHLDADYGIKEKLTHVSGIGMDLITFEVMRNAFVAACYEASTTTIERVAYHPVVGMGRDRSDAILTRDGGWSLTVTPTRLHITRRLVHRSSNSSRTVRSIRCIAAIRSCFPIRTGPVRTSTTRGSSARSSLTMRSLRSPAP